MKSALIVLVMLCILRGQYASYLDANRLVNQLVTHEVTFTVTSNGAPLGNIKLGLFGKTHPKTVANFAAFASPNGYRGKSYKNTEIYGANDQFIEGGDVMHNDGTGTFSIFNSFKFPDEHPTVPLKQAGLLAMATNPMIPDSNGCRFIISLKPIYWPTGIGSYFGIVLNDQSLSNVFEIASSKIRTSNAQTERWREPDSHMMLPVTIKIVDTSVVELAKPYPIEF